MSPPKRPKDEWEDTVPDGSKNFPETTPFAQFTRFAETHFAETHLAPPQFRKTERLGAIDLPAPKGEVVNVFGWQRVKDQTPEERYQEIKQGLVFALQVMKAEPGQHRRELQIFLSNAVKTIIGLQRHLYREKRAVEPHSADHARISRLEENLEGLVPDRYIDDNGLSALMADLNQKSFAPAPPEDPRKLIAHNTFINLKNSILTYQGIGVIGASEIERKRDAQTVFEVAMNSIKTSFTVHPDIQVLARSLLPDSQKGLKNGEVLRALGGIKLADVARRFPDGQIPYPLAQAAPPAPPEPNRS